jgi:hypothetical protein
MEELIWLISLESRWRSDDFLYISLGRRLCDCEGRGSGKGGGEEERKVRERAHAYERARERG